MTQTGDELGELPTSLRSSRRERKAKRRYSDYLSDDSAVEVDLDSASDAEYGPSKGKRFKSGKALRGSGKTLKCPNLDERAPGLAAAAAELQLRDGEKMLMRQWLQKQADDETIPGLRWYDEAKTMIRIPWKHGSRTGWTIDDCRVYEAWAIHTGKIACINQPKKWKANFRCALNSLPDVKEQQNLGQKKGNDPFKIYKMLPEVPRKSLAKKIQQCKAEMTVDEPLETHHFMPDIEMKTLKEEVPPVQRLEAQLAWPCNVDTSFIKIETPEMEMKPSQSLIPTVVEELDEKTNGESLTVTNNQPLYSSITNSEFMNSEFMMMSSFSPYSTSSSLSLSSISSSDDSIQQNDLYLGDPSNSMFLTDLNDLVLQELDPLSMSHISDMWL